MINHFMCLTKVGGRGSFHWHLAKHGLWVTIHSLERNVTDAEHHEGFIAHFSSLTTRFEDEYRVTYRGAVQGPDQWQGLMKLAKKQTVRLMLRAGG